MFKGELRDALKPFEGQREEVSALEQRLAQLDPDNRPDERDLREVSIASHVLRKLGVSVGSSWPIHHISFILSGTLIVVAIGFAFSGLSNSGWIAVVAGIGAFALAWIGRDLLRIERVVRFDASHLMPRFAPYDPALRDLHSDMETKGAQDSIKRYLNAAHENDWRLTEFEVDRLRDELVQSAHASGERESGSYKGVNE